VVPGADRLCFLCRTAPLSSSGRDRATRLPYSRTMPPLSGDHCQRQPSQASHRPRSGQNLIRCPNRSMSSSAFPSSDRSNVRSSTTARRGVKSAVTVLPAGWSCSRARLPSVAGAAVGATRACSASTRRVGSGCASSTFPHDRATSAATRPSYLPAAMHHGSSAATACAWVRPARRHAATVPWKWLDRSSTSRRASRSRSRCGRVSMSTASAATTWICLASRRLSRTARSWSRSHAGEAHRLVPGAVAGDAQPRGGPRPGVVEDR
jgi:hypothetical protein